MSAQTVIAAIAACLLAGAAAAQDLESYEQRRTDLASLAGLFGELHHIRRTCEPRYEGDVWRERMKTLMDLEEPQESEREAMVQAFNKGYRDAQRRFPSCDRNARDYAAGRASQGDAIVARLTQSLRQAQEETFSASPLIVAPAPEIDD
jgi:uncharacterized protein (TIGR02301 family)